MYKFSEHGIKNPKLFKEFYTDFIEYCKTLAKQGTFSTYCCGEPVFLCMGAELPYSEYRKRVATHK